MGVEIPLFWIISLEIGDYKGTREIGDYRGKYKIHRGSRVRGCLFTGVYPPLGYVLRLDFPVFWLLICYG